MDHPNFRQGQLDAANLCERLQQEQKDYWMHLEAASPLEKYPAKQHAQRIAEKLGVSEGLIYLRGERRRYREDSDMAQPFWQRRYFFYLSGCNEPDCHLTYDIQNDSLSLFLPTIDPKRVIYDGRGSTPTEALDKYDIDRVYLNPDLDKYIKSWVARHHGNLFLLHDSHGPAKVTTGERVDTKSLLPAMNAARLIKDAFEIKLIRKANHISSKAHRAILANIRKFKNEAEVEGLFVDVCTSHLAKDQAYAPICASGTNAGQLHYDDNDQPLEGRQLMCLDAGCSWNCYASDITRTFPLAGAWPSKEAKAIHDLVERMQETCIKRIRPGVRYLDLHILAHQIAIDGLLALGILHNGTKEEILKAGTSRAFFPHGLGHHVGLDVHDPGQAQLMALDATNASTKIKSIYPEDFHASVYDSNTCRSPVDPASPHLQEGMVVTVEPGIYFSPVFLKLFFLPNPTHAKYINLEVVKRYLPVGGVRIEDDILVTSTGYENLTTAPKGDAMLRIIQTGNADLDAPTDSSSDQRRPRGAWAEPGSTGSQQDQRQKRAPGMPLESSEPEIDYDSLLSGIRDANRTLNVHNSTATGPRARETGDFEPSKKPTLFSNFNPTAAQRSDFGPPSRAERSKKLILPQTLCGNVDHTLKHAYVTLLDVTVSDFFHAGSAPKSACRKCQIILEKIDQIRLNLAAEDKKPSKDAIPSGGMTKEGPERRQKAQVPQRAPSAPTTQPVPVPAASRNSSVLEKWPRYRQSMPNLNLASTPLASTGVNPQAVASTFLPGRNLTASPEPAAGRSRPEPPPESMSQRGVPGMTPQTQWPNHYAAFNPANAVDPLPRRSITDAGPTSFMHHVGTGASAPTIARGPGQFQWPGSARIPASFHAPGPGPAPAPVPASAPASTPASTPASQPLSQTLARVEGELKDVMERLRLVKIKADEEMRKYSDSGATSTRTPTATSTAAFTPSAPFNTGSMTTTTTAMPPQSAPGPSYSMDNFLPYIPQPQTGPTTTVGESRGSRSKAYVREDKARDKEIELRKRAELLAKYVHRPRMEMRRSEEGCRIGGVLIRGRKVQGSGMGDVWKVCG